MNKIKIKGYTNTWSSIDMILIDNKYYYLMENDEYGDETCYLVITQDQNTIIETFDDIETTLIDNNILKGE